jgi:hypothetical protein
MRRAVLLPFLLLGFPALPVNGQDPLSIVSGAVLTEAGQPLQGVNVFLLETLEGSLTDSLGAFRFETTLIGDATLAALRLGSAEERRAVRLPLNRPVIIVLVEVVNVEAITARVGGYTASDEPGATLTSLDVVTTPGAAASIPLAIKALPGVQAVDDGSGLFVRGGDDEETRFFLNDAGILDGVSPEEPVGSDAPQIDPFLLDGIFFSSGAFGARYGNALSAVVDLETQGRPESFTPEVGAHMAGLEGSVRGPFGKRLGGAVTLSRLHVGPIYAVNGSTRSYRTAPQGWEASTSLVWDDGADAEVKAFAIGETFETEFEVEEASLSDLFRIESRSGAAIVTWRDLIGRVAPIVSLSRSGERSTRAGGAFRLVDDRTSGQAFGSLALSLDRALLTMGAEIERLDARFEGSFPTDPARRGEGAPVERLDMRATSDRVGAFVESEWSLTSRLLLTTGLRTDRSDLSGQRTWDPRISMVLALPSGISLLVGGGAYHQVPDPLLYARSASVLDPMRAVQLVVGAQAGSPDVRLARVEVYRKDYHDLAQLDRNDRPVGGGEGSSHGLDVFLKGPGPWGTSGWISYSLVDAKRTDPDTGELARAPFDVTHGLTVIARKELGPGLYVRAGWRYSTGRPFTDVIGAAHDADLGGWTPSFGEPFGDRLPANHRLDISASRLVSFGEDGLAVFFASLNNVYDRFNVLEYRWSDGYAERIPVRDRTRRSVFLGMSIEF